MDDQKKSDLDNVIELKGRKKSNKSRNVDRKGGSSKKDKGSGTGFGKYSFWQYIQLFMLLGLATYLMQQCRG